MFRPTPRTDSKRVVPAGLTGRYAAIDHLKALAIVAVCVTHALPNVLAAGTTSAERIASAMSSFHLPALLFAAGFLATRRGRVDLPRVGAQLARVLGPYLVASLVAVALLHWQLTTARNVAFWLATGSALGPYYFVPVLACCLLVLPLVSRLGVVPLAAVLATLAAYAWGAWLNPSWRLTHGFFWGIRDGLFQFYLGDFLLGVLAARLLPRLRHLRERAAPLCLVAALVAIAAFAWLATGEKLTMWAPVVRGGYLLGVVGLIATIVPRGVAPGPVRFLSEATLTIYLYHQMIYPMLLPPLRAALPPGLAVVATATCGLAFGVTIAWAGRRLLGARSRLLIGT